MGALRVLEIAFFIYFASHIPITLFIDSQALVPLEYYPKQLTNLTSWYVRELKDTYFKAPPLWYQSFVYCEQILQMPFFFVASYAFLKGKCQWIRIPAIIYSSHVATTVLPMLVSYAFEDFSKHDPVGPSTFEERAILIAIYMPYFIIPCLILLTMLMSSMYRGDITQSSTTSKKNNRKKYH